MTDLIIRGGTVVTATGSRPADLAITGVALAGVIAFAHGRRLIGADVWRAWAWAFPMWNAVYMLHFQGAAFLDFTWVPMNVFLLPAYASLFLYGYASSRLWRS